MAVLTPYSYTSRPGQPLVAGRYASRLAGGIALSDADASGAMLSYLSQVGGSAALDDIAASGTLSDKPAYLASADTFQWVAAGASPASSPQLAPAVANGTMGSIANVVNAYSGAAAINGELLINGGGHGDYCGNEIHGINLTADSPAWVKRIERSDYSQVLGGSNYYLDGKPTSRHTYYGLWGATIGGRPKMLQFCTWMGNACYLVGIWPGTNASNVTTTNINCFDLLSNTWDAPVGPLPGSFLGESENSMCMDPATGDFYAIPQVGAVYRYRPSDNSSTELRASALGNTGKGGALVFDAAAQRLIRFGGRSGATVHAWDVGTYTKTTPTLTGPDASALSGLTGDNPGWGVAHDTKRGVVYLMTNAAVLYRIRISDLYVERVTTTGATPAAPTPQTWGRLKYIPEIDAIAYLANWSSPVLVMKCG